MIFLCCRRGFLIDIVQLIALTIACAVIYLLIHEVHSKYAKLFCLFLITYFFWYAFQILLSIIGEITTIFLNFEVGQEYVQMAFQLIGIVFFAEFVTIFLAEVTQGNVGDLKNVGKIFEYIVKLYLISYSLPMIITLFELILSII